MTKYQELVGMAAKWGADYENASIFAFQTAHALRAQYARYLGAHGNKIMFYEHDARHVQSAKRPLQHSPKTVLGPDGVFYFGLAVDLIDGDGGVIQYMEIGVVRIGKSVTFSRSGRTFESPADEPPTEFMDFLFQQSCEQYAEPLVGRGKTPIGFLSSYIHQTKQNDGDM